MKVKELFNSSDDISVESYLSKFNTYYQCKSDKDVEDLWNWFNEQGGVRYGEYTDTLEYMKHINKENHYKDYHITFHNVLSTSVI